MIERDRILTELISDKERALKKAPKGGLKVAKKKNSYQYYWKHGTTKPDWAYIPRKDISVAASLAQRDYDIEILKAAQREQKIVKDYLSAIKDKTIESVYDSLTEGRQRLINPILLSDKDYVAIWKSQEYDRMAFNDDAEEHYSINGTRVRSKSEEIIANLLEHYNIPYRYEYPLNLKRTIHVRPDFVCLNVACRREIVWEHFGMMDDLGYANKNIQKITLYEQNGYIIGENMITTFESSLVPLNSNTVKSKIVHYLL